MKKIRYIFILGLAFMMQPVHAEEPVVMTTVLPFLQALQAGDVNRIESFMDGKLLRDNRILLRKNKNYPEFLRNLYKDAVFHVAEVKKSQDDFLVNIAVTYPDSNSNHINIRIKQVDSSGAWKIVEQLKDI